MPPKKSTETKATAKGQATEKTDTSKIVPKKEANNNAKEEPNFKPRSRLKRSQQSRWNLLRVLKIPPTKVFQSPKLPGEAQDAL
jgi:hypothetical protein